MIISIKKIAVNLIAILTLLGCTTPPLKKFPGVKVGMDKTDVLELVGSPTSKEREDGTDIWHYRFWDEDKWVDKVIIIKLDRVTYSGDPLTKETLYRGTNEPSGSH